MMSVRAIVPLLLAASLPFPAEIVDRVAASVGNRVITESEVLEEIRVTAFIEGVPLNFSAEQKRVTLDRLIDQELMRQNIVFARFPLPTESDIKPLYDQIRSRYPSAEQYQAALASYGLSDSDIRAHLQWQVTALRFIEYRFQPGVQVSDSQLKREYDKYAARWRAEKGTEPPPLDDVRTTLEDTVKQELVDSALDRWLGEVRTRNKILYRKGYEQ